MGLQSDWIIWKKHIYRTEIEKKIHQIKNKLYPKAIQKVLEDS